MPINLPRMSLDWGRKPEYPEETPEARGEHANSTHTHGGGGNRTPTPGGLFTVRLKRNDVKHRLYKSLNIHSLSTAYPNYSRVTGSLCLSQASLGIKAGYTLDGVSTHRRAHTHSHSLTQSHTTDNLEMTINLPRMSLDWGRKPEYPEETPEAWREHANSTHTAEAGIEPPNPGGVRQTC
ncbi:hypothetical protein QTP86_033196 [Hemibagrus guttatus]|nr:hypothetical protein QTP86_033196 [Hemibagrus guttatus]